MYGQDPGECLGSVWIVLEQRSPRGYVCVDKIQKKTIGQSMEALWIKEFSKCIYLL